MIGTNFATSLARERVIAAAAQSLSAARLDDEAYAQWRPFVVALSDEECSLMVHWMEVFGAEQEPLREPGLDRRLL